MTTQVHAVYEKGVLKPSTPVDLPEGARVDIIILSEGISVGSVTAADLLEEIARMPAEKQPDDDIVHAAREHDRVLYRR